MTKCLTGVITFTFERSMQIKHNTKYFVLYTK